MTNHRQPAPLKLPRGTQDILPDAWPLWRHAFRTAERVAEGAGYARIETPMFESTSLFTHATGEHTDVNREMYTFEDRGGDELSLRPEGTASVFRAYFQHGMKVLAQPVKLYYIGSMFRYERPQRGRFREHHQFGCEAIGSSDPLVDASLVAVQDRYYRALSVGETRIQVNSIGDQSCRPGFLIELVAYLRQHTSELCGQCRDRVERNPLRVLDCKVESCQPVLDAAPRMLDSLCDDCRSHWDGFMSGIHALDLPAEVNPRLVRGLDYYTRTVWEFQPDAPGGAQSTLGGGGRYDALAEAIGAPATPGVGFSTGVERVMLNIDSEIAAGLASDSIDAFVTSTGPEAELLALSVTAALWSDGIRADMSFDNRSLGTQLKQANARDAAVAILLGDQELAREIATVKLLRSGEQREIPLADIQAVVHDLISGLR